ncbi:MAG: hypothetical protein WC508_05225 [Patescibacteria group bacterium]
MTEKLSEIQKRFLNEAVQKKAKVGVGIWRPEPTVVRSVIEASQYCDLTVVGTKIDGLNCLETKDDDQASQVIVDLLKQGKIQGVVRAQLKDSYTHELFLKEFKRPKDEFKISVSFFAKDDQWFVVPSASNYASLSLEAKRQEIFAAAEWLESNLGLKPTIAITSTRRPTGRVGEFGLLEEIAERCETVAKELKEKGYDVKEYYIEYEKAVWEGRTLICPAIGMIGNTWTKGLVYLGDWTWVSSFYLNQGVYWNNAPRNNSKFFWPIISTAAWINRGKI